MTEWKRKWMNRYMYEYMDNGMTIISITHQNDN